MNCLFRNANIFVDGHFISSDLFVEGGIIAAVGKDFLLSESTEVIDLNNSYIFPGLIDVHVHLREPGFSYKETISTGSLAAAHGGYTEVCAMPNLYPVPDSAEHLNAEIEKINTDAVIGVHPYGAITVGEEGKELSELEKMSSNVIAFSDDGKGVQSDEMMLEAMKKAKSLNKIIAAHCEVNDLLRGGYIHKGSYAAAHGHKGICSESEYKQIERDIELARKTGVLYHVCHISTKESVELIRKAKASGVDITCETGPHYLTLTDADLQEDGRFKMNPPLRDKEDRAALIEGIIDGTIDMIATDHAPHSAEEKSKGLEKSTMGVTGLECAFPIIYTKLVRTGIISLEKSIELMHINPKKRFNIGTDIEIGAPASFTVFDLSQEYIINPDTFLSMGKATPFKGEKVFGKCLMTVYNGKIVYKEKCIETD